MRNNTSPIDNNKTPSRYPKRNRVALTKEDIPGDASVSDIKTKESGQNGAATAGSFVSYDVKEAHPIDTQDYASGSSSEAIYGNITKDIRQNDNQHVLKFGAGNPLGKLSLVFTEGELVITGLRIESFNVGQIELKLGIYDKEEHQIVIEEKVFNKYIKSKKDQKPQEQQFEMDFYQIDHEKLVNYSELTLTKAQGKEEQRHGITKLMFMQKSAKTQKFEQFGFENVSSAVKSPQKVEKDVEKSENIGSVCDADNVQGQPKQSQSGIKSQQRQDRLKNRNLAKQCEFNGVVPTVDNKEQLKNLNKEKMEIEEVEKTSELDEQQSPLNEEDKNLQKALEESKRDQSMKADELEEYDKKQLQQVLEASKNDITNNDHRNVDYELDNSSVEIVSQNPQSITQAQSVATPMQVPNSTKQRPPAVSTDLFSKIGQPKLRHDDSGSQNSTKGVNNSPVNNQNEPKSDWVKDIKRNHGALSTKVYEALEADQSSIPWAQDHVLNENPQELKTPSVLDGEQNVKFTEPAGPESNEKQDDPKLDGSNYIQKGQPLQEPDFYKIISEEEQYKNNLYAQVAYWRHKVRDDIQFGYHDENRATHNDGIHHQQFLSNKKNLQNAVEELHHLLYQLQNINKSSQSEPSSARVQIVNNNKD